MEAILTDNQEKIVRVCKSQHVRRLSAFGSAAREDFEPGRSDVDLLVGFEPPGKMEYAPNYFSFMDALDGVFGMKIDLLTDQCFRNPCLRKYIQVVNFRNRLIHAYFAIDEESVWSTSKIYVPDLVAQVRALIGRIEAGTAPPALSVAVPKVT